MPKKNIDELANALDKELSGVDVSKNSVRSFIVDETQNCNVTKSRRKTEFVLSERSKPIMTAEVEAEIEMALIQYNEKTKWKEWGLDTLKKQGACISLAGPAGCGKTSIAHYMSKRVGRGVITLNMRDVSGKAPGEIEKNVAEIFRKGESENNKTIILDECEAILIDRSRAGNDSLWVISVVNEVLMQIAKYKGLVVLATNYAELLDKALLDRCFAALQIEMPATPERIRLWQQKIPARFPFQPTQVQIETLADVPINGRNIELAIMREASDAIKEKRKPTLSGLVKQARILEHKHE